MDGPEVREGGEGTAGIAALLLAVERDWYAIELGRVLEVVAEPLVTSLPTARRPLIGVFNLRGEIVPLFDTAALLGVGSMVAPSFAVVVATGVGPGGLGTTRMPEAVDLTDSIGPGEAHGSPMYAVGRRVARLVDPEAVLLSASPRS